MRLTNYNNLKLAGCCLIFLFCCFYITPVYASQPVTARYVQIELPGDGRILSLAEVEVYSGEEIISLRGQARQVNTAWGGDASRAIDGNTSGDFFAKSVTGSDGSFAWWELDLGTEQVITRIIIYNRTDCCGERINPARILLFNNAREIVWQDTILSNAPKYDFQIEKATGQQLLKISPNLLRNATFQQQTNPLIPDFWDLHPVTLTKFKNLHTQYYVDKSVESPVAGTDVLRIHNSEADFYHTMLIPRILFTPLPEGYYTFSVYIKADRNNTRIGVTPRWAIGNEITKSLSTEWKRYSFTFKLPITGQKTSTLHPILRFPEKGIYFIAAPQLEKGKKASVFQPAYEDTRIKDPITPSLKNIIPPQQAPGFANSIFVDGQPFYIIGMAVSRVLPDWYLSEIKEHGINTLLFYRFPGSDGLFSEKTISALETVLSAAARHDLKVIFGKAVAGAKPDDWRERVNSFTKLMKRFKNNPVIIGWYPVDEPAAHTWQDNELLEIYTTVKELDPDRFVFMSWAHDGVPQEVGQQPRGTLQATDIYSVAYYPFASQGRSMEGFTETIIRVAKTARMHKKSFHSWLQLYGHMEAWREPTGIELNYMAYLNFIYGGMISYWEVKSSSAATWAQVKTTNHEGRILADKLFLNPDAQEILPPIEDGKFIYSAWKKGDSVFMIVVNRNAVPGEFVYDLSMLTPHISLPGTRVRSVFEERNVTLTKGYIKEMFPPLGTRVYEFYEQ